MNSAHRSAALAGAAVALILLTSPAWGQLRVLRAQDPTGKWYQRIDGGRTVAAEAFQEEVAAQFGVSKTQVIPVESTMTRAELEQAGNELAAGSHAGQAVVLAPRPVIEDADGLRRGLGGIFAGPPATKQARWGAVLEKYPAASAVLTVLRGQMTPDAKATVIEIVTRICRRVGALDEVLTATEYDALRSLAGTKGLGSLVPPRPCA